VVVIGRVEEAVKKLTHVLGGRGVFENGSLKQAASALNKACTGPEARE